jgi:hypothetical protein
MQALVGTPRRIIQAHKGEVAVELAIVAIDRGTGVNDQHVPGLEPALAGVRIDRLVTAPARGLFSMPLVPELQWPGLFHTEYEGDGTLRGSLSRGRLAACKKKIERMGIQA